MSIQNNYKTYDINSSVVFRKTKEKYGGLSNMASDYQIKVNDINILTSEALYQALRFPLNPEIQKIIIEQRSPMTAKMKSKKYRNVGRKDWDEIRVRVMKWCIRVKLVNNWKKFGELLDSTGHLPIVEYSHKDSFWGAIPSIQNENLLIGENVLGRLLMELREEYRYVNEKRHYNLLTPKIDCFYLNNKEIDNISITLNMQINNNKKEKTFQDNYSIEQIKWYF